MNIACLGWGSLIWQPRHFPAVIPWHEDGPCLPIEFARPAKDKRLTLVVLERGNPVRCLWTRMNLSGLDEARTALAEREEIPKGHIEDGLGCWRRGERGQHAHCDVIDEWATAKGLDAVIWTALPPKFGGTRGRVPTG